jgi:predicted metal-dependent peptidase
VASLSPVKVDVPKELIKGVVYMARHKEFYGHIIQQFQKIFVKGEHEVSTAAVGRIPGDRFIKLYLHEGFFGKIFQEHDQKTAVKYMLGVLEHEILHVVFGHLFLRFQDKVRGAVAVDCVVNSVLPKETLPEPYVHPEQYGFPEDKSAMWYYTHLRDNKKFKQQCASGQFGADGVLEHIMDSHGMWEDVKDDLLAREFSKDIIRKAKELCGKSYGDIPGRVIDRIDDLLKSKKPIVPWGRVLRLFCASAAESVLDYTVKRRSKRFGTRPGTRKADVLKLAVAVDTSGSIADWQLRMFWNEINWIRRNGAEVWVFECDTELSPRSPMRYTGKWDGNVHGRGGTDLEPPLKAAEGKYDAIISFTDFCAPKISTKYRIPVLWVLTQEMSRENYPYEWGRHILIDQESGKAVPA